MRRPSTTPPPKADVFCQKCLTNQHLFISSIAQYFPEDPDDPEVPQLERNYYRFRRNTEKRYPQVCQDCLPKVEAELHKAAYTAKSDHLRRMLDRSKETRVLTTRSAVHQCHDIGYWLWIFSFVMQLLWHILLIHQAVLANAQYLGPKSWAILSARVFDLFIPYLPSADRVISWSFWFSLLSFWWNPKWVEVYNGFHRHLHGFRTYYLYQAMILALKVPPFFKLDILPTSQDSRITVHVVAHLSMVLFMYLLYSTTCGSIRTDHAPLWLPKPSSIGADPPQEQSTQMTDPHGGGEQSMGDILDEILGESTSRSPHNPEPLMNEYSGPDQFDHMPSAGQRSLYSPSTGSPRPNPFQSLSSQRQSAAVGSNLSPGIVGSNTYLGMNTRQQPMTSGSSFTAGNFGSSPSMNTRSRHQQAALSSTGGLDLDGLRLSDSPQKKPRQQSQYDTEMDWSPTVSKHRAFNTRAIGQPLRKGFNEAPTTDRPGVFWAKIPENPAFARQRLLNPLNQNIAPRIRTSPIITTNAFQFKGPNTGSSFAQPHTRVGEVAFAQPKFFPKPPPDERDTLAELFKRSFTLNPSSEDNNPSSNSTVHKAAVAQNAFFVFLGIFLAVLAPRAYEYVSKTVL